MTTPNTAAPTAECQVGTANRIVEFVHGLGGPVQVHAYSETGAPVGYNACIEISDDEVEVVVVPGTVARLVAQRIDDSE